MTSAALYGDSIVNDYETLCAKDSRVAKSEQAKSLVFRVCLTLPTTV